MHACLPVRTTTRAVNKARFSLMPSLLLQLCSNSLRGDWPPCPRSLRVLRAIPAHKHLQPRYVATLQPQRLLLALTLRNCSHSLHAYSVRTIYAALPQQHSRAGPSYADLRPFLLRRHTCLQQQFLQRQLLAQQPRPADVSAFVHVHSLLHRR